MVGRNHDAGTSLMDRRCFVRTAGLAATGAAFGCSMMGCEVVVDGPSIPCLSVVQAPVPVAGMTYIKASEIGCALDCDLSIGYNKYTFGAATDDGPRINAAMAGASASNPITLIIDGSALISGLFLPAGGYWSIAGLGCCTGFFVKSGTNNDGIHNGGPNATVLDGLGPPPPARGSNVSLSNFTLNGNQGNGHSGDSTTGAYQGSSTNGWYFGINLMNLNNITIENVVVVNSPSYHFRFSNVGNVTVSGCVMKSIGLNTDGLHFDGPANDITISNCDFTMGDDAIALNCPEGHTGNISRVSVTNCTFNSWSLMRLYTHIGQSDKYTIDTVSVSNSNGTLWEYAFPIGLSSGSRSNSVASLTISDCDLTAPTVLAMAENFGTIVLQNVRFTPSGNTVSWVPPQSNHVCALLRPSPYYPGVTVVGSRLSFQNCSIVRKENMNVAAVILQVGSDINSVEFDGFGVQDNYSHVEELIDIEESAIGLLAINSLNSSNIEYPTQPGGFTSLSSVTGTGTGVLATGWEFPDAIMANNVPYISASTGQPSIKINGVVEPYDPS